MYVYGHDHVESRQQMITSGYEILVTILLMQHFATSVWCTITACRRAEEQPSKNCGESKKQPHI